MNSNANGPKAVVLIFFLVSLSGVLWGVHSHSIGRIVMYVGAAIGCVGFWQNPQFLTSRVNALPEQVQKTPGGVSRLLFRGATLLMLVGIVAALSGY